MWVAVLDEPGVRVEQVCVEQASLQVYRFDQMLEAAQKQQRSQGLMIPVYKV